MSERGYFRRASVRIVVLLVLCVGVGASAAAAASRPGVYLALGDSLAAGFGASSPERAYVPLVFAHLQTDRRPPVSELVNLGVPGATTATLITGQLPQSLQVIDDPTAVVRDVTIDIGANDLLGNPSCFANPMSCAFIETNLATILSTLTDDLRRHHEHARIAILAYYNAWSGLGILMSDVASLALVGADRKVDCGASGAAIGLNDMIACTARLYGVSVANAFPPFQGRAAQLVNPGDIHANDAGHAVIAGLFDQALAPR